MKIEYLDIIWMLLCSGLVFMMQAGFLCLESGATRSKNSIDIAIKNMMDFAVSSFIFWCFGFAILFGVSQNGWFGTTGFFPSLSDNPGNATFFLFQLMFCGTATTIVSGAVSERIRFKSYMFIAAILSGFIYTLFGHWAWNGIRETQSQGWLEALGFIDFAGSTVVHSLGGWVALAAVIILGPREGRFSREGNVKEIRGHSFPMSLLGVFLLWIGWLGFNGGGNLHLDNNIPRILVNTMMAGVSGVVTAFVIGWILTSERNIHWIINGSLAGLVSVTASCHAITVPSAIIIGAVGCVVMIIIQKLLFRFRIDDAVDAIPVHVGAGVWGTLAVALFASSDIFSGRDRVTQLLIQALGCFVCFLLAFVIMYFILRILNFISHLRVSSGGERVGLNICEYGASTEFYDVIETMEMQEKTEDISIRLAAEPATEIGQISRCYNRVMDALEQSVAKTNAIINTMKDGIVTFTEKGVVTSLNPAAETIFGYSKAELCGHPITTLFSLNFQKEDKKEDFSKPISLASTYFREKKYHELLVQRKDRSKFPAELAFSQAKVGKKLMYIGLIRDITERKEATEKIHEEQARLQAILDIAINPIIVINDRGIVKIFNLAAEKLFGYAPDEIIGHNVNMIVPFPDKEKHDYYLKRYLKTGKKHIIGSRREVKGERKDGSHFPVSLAVSECVLGNRKLFVGILHDLTSQKKTMVALEKSKEMAEKANRAKSEFLANMSHELRTPLNGIVGFTQILLDDALSQEQRDGLEIIKKCSDTLLGLINNVLDLAKIEADRMELEKITFNFEEIVYDCCDIVRSKIENKPLEILVDIQNIHASVIGDPTRLSQVLTNLLGNAVKFTDRGQIIVSLRTIREDKETTTIECSVTDTGIGMTQEQQERIFSAFAQADGSVTRKYGGTGLGLSISREFIRLMNSTLQLKSRQGKGTTFFFALSLEKGKGQDISKVKTSRSQYIREKRCLVIDDNPTAIRIMESLISHAGMRVVSGSSVEEGLDIFQKSRPFDLIFFDLRMPDADGFTLVKRLRDISDHPLPKLILITADVRPQTISRIKEHKLDGYLFKPVRKALFINLLHSLFRPEVLQDPMIHDLNISSLSMESSCKILVAEDNLVNQKVMVKILEKMGHQVDIVENGLKAVQKLQKEEFDLVFMDMQMPVMNGITATMEIRKLGIKIPIVALTANAMESDRKKCLQSGMDDYISKPVKRHIVTDIIEKYCGYTAGSNRFTATSPRILIVHNDEYMIHMLSETIRENFPYISCKYAKDGVEGCTFLGSFFPHLVITDLILSKMDGLEIIRYIRTSEQYKNTEVIVVTALEKNDPKIQEALRLRVRKVIHKPCPETILIKEIRRALKKICTYTMGSSQ